MPSIYEQYVLPRVILLACGSKNMARQRGKVVPLAEGRVLELGIGGGLNLRFYDPAKVTGVVGVDPSAPLRERALRAEHTVPVDVRDGAAEALPFETGSFDTVVCTFTLCSVDSPERALAEARRVLKPGGKLLFCEHGLAPDPSVRKWQQRIEPVWKRLGGGCHLTRPVAAGIERSGFTLEHVESMYLPGTPRFAGWNEWGVATPR